MIQIDTTAVQETPLSAVQKGALQSLADGASGEGVQPRTLAALSRRGFIDGEAVTEAGRQALNGKPKRRRRRRAPRAATTPRDVAPEVSPFVARLVAVVDEELADLDEKAKAIEKERRNAERIRAALVK